jgi:diketogulonate reductase-like aldo/keto reductase
LWLIDAMAATAPPFNHELGIGTNKWTLSNIDQVKTTYGAALDAGISLFDTAQCYTSSEACLGYVRKRDRRPFIVTKFDSLSGGPDRLVPTLRKSLFDLNIDFVDAYLIHFPRGDVDALAAALASAVELGLTKRVGCSNYGLAEMLRLRGALKKHGVALAIVEIEFSLLRRRSEAMVNECRQLGIAVLAWAPLGSGRLVHARDVGDPRTRAVSGMLDVIARRRGKTPAQVALNWVIYKGAVPIPGARTRAQAVENCGAAGWRLLPDDVQALDAVAVQDGGYYNDPEAVLTFLRLGIRCPHFLRGVVHAVVRCCLRLGAYFLPLQRDDA